MLSLLDNIAWHTLAGPQSHFASGTDTARRYAPGFSPIVGFADPAQPDFAALVPFCAPGERFYCPIWTGAAPDGWRIEVDTVMLQMVWEGDLPDDDPQLDALPLGPEHAPLALALAERTHPGPFGLRTLELGEYFGLFDGPRLMAMAGERMRAGTLHEISGVCTHPDYQGRGHARRLTLKLVRRQQLRGETTFLHVMRDNVGARRLYERLGFRDHQEVPVRVVSRC